MRRPRRGRAAIAAAYDVRSETAFPKIAPARDNVAIGVTNRHRMAKSKAAKQIVGAGI